jgi:hypothetical protein
VKQDNNLRVKILIKNLMKMKRVLVAGAAVLLSATMYAQEMTVSANRTTFGIRAGVNFNTINGKDINNNDIDYNISTGYHAGLNAEIPIGTGTYLQPGILYSLKGGELEGSKDKVRLSYIEVPVNFVYKPKLGTGNMLLGFGPYAAMGISGKVERNGAESDVEFVNDYADADLTKTPYKRFDAGANFLAGYEFANKLSFQVNAQLGLLNIAPDGAPDKKLNNTGFGLSLGYRF